MSGSNFVGEFTAKRQEFITALGHLTHYRALWLSLMLEESWTSCLKHGVSHKPFSLLIFVEKIMVVLVSFQFHSIPHSRCGHLGRLKCPFLENLGHSFWAFLLDMYLGKCSLFGVLVFGRRGSHAKARAASGVGQEIVVQSQAGYFVVQQLDLYRVEHADLEGQRFVSCFFGSIKRCASSPKAPSH